MERNIDKVLKQLQGVSGVSIPVGRHIERHIKHSLYNAYSSYPITFYVGSCPDYSYSNGVYDHQNLGRGVPLLAKCHINSDLEILRILDTASIPYRFNIMVADVESNDDYLCQKFTNGCEEEFLKRCHGSVEAIRKYMEKIKDREGLQGELTSSSFYQEFGRERFLGYQNSYTDLLVRCFQEDLTFRERVETDVKHGFKLYAKMYPHVTARGASFLSEDNREFLNMRTIRTMAQYLTLGRLIAESSQFPILINHPTRNSSAFNDRNRFVLPEDSGKTQEPIIIFSMNKSVY